MAPIESKEGIMDDGERWGGTRKVPPVTKTE